MNKCERCKETIDDCEKDMHWPAVVINNDKCEYVCPSCYGDGAYCVVCGRLLPATCDNVVCNKCG